MASRLARLGNAAVQLTKAGLTPSLVAYFFWVGSITSIFGVFTYTSYGTLSSFLCNIPGEVNETDGYTVGCANCSDTLLLCGTSLCWRAAFNLTWQEDGSTPNAQYYGDFQEAVLDQRCNSLVRTADSPVALLNGIIEQRAKTANAEPSEACVNWNCRVLVRAMMRSLGTELSGPGICTNEKGIKRAYEADVCPCDAVEVSMYEASNFQSLCGAMSEGLAEAVFARELSFKDACFESSMDAALLVNPVTFREAATNVNCSYSLFLTSTVSLPVWLKTVWYLDSLGAADWQIRASCRSAICTAFWASLGNLDCNWTTSEFLQIDQLDIDKIDTYCAEEFNGFGISFTRDYLCEQQSFNQTLYCTAGADSTSGRRLTKWQPDLEELHVALRASKVPRPKAPAPVIEAPQAVMSSARAPASGYTHGTLQQAVVGFDGVEVDSVEALDGCRGDTCKASERRLTAAPAPSANNDDLQDWTVTDWSRCTCYQQCTPGVTTRSVSCPPGVTCKEPKPTAARACVCKHCSDCDVLMFVWATFACYVITGSVCYLLWLGFLAVSMYEEDDYTGMSISLKCLGCFCRTLPFLIKVMTYVDMFCIVLLVITALTPIGDTFSDCKGSESMEQMAIAGLVAWALQLSIGFYMHKFKPMPPWLHSASSSRAMKLLCKPFNAVGP
eukprot:TRINITY_DN81031_c0_g1_i1.p1 TRINITY_DN81031_c0_g1~~TRINITY_DN81031_c0_g1_i1.p1  ORF type:complete len:670 (-),score=96.20 TRINITY_DN81031_c0_g1_i1:64-2073(-)